MTAALPAQHSDACRGDRHRELLAAHVATTDTVSRSVMHCQRASYQRAVGSVASLPCDIIMQFAPLPQVIVQSKNENDTESNVQVAVELRRHLLEQAEARPRQRDAVRVRQVRPHTRPAAAATTTAATAAAITRQRRRAGRVRRRLPRAAAMPVEVGVQPRQAEHHVLRQAAQQW
jgi:hypothetical protein